MEKAAVVDPKAGEDMHAAVRRDYAASVISFGEGQEKRLLVNGIGMTSLTPITKFMVHLPLAHHAGPSQSALIICFGMGTSFRSALSWGVSATAVELVPSVPAFFDYFHSDAHELLRLPQAKVVIDDGRRFLDRSAGSYDVIIIDPPPPMEAAASSLLYSREFYESARRRLLPGGILQQWLPGASNDDPVLMAAVVKAVAQLVLILMVSAFLLVDAVRVRTFLRGLVPHPHRDAFDVVAAQIDRGLSGVIRGQFLICLVNGVLTYIGLLILKVKYPLLLGMLAGGMSLIPVFGSILSSIPIVALALVGGGSGGGLAMMKGLGTLGWIIGIHLLEANFLNPKIIGHAARIHPLVVIFSLIVGETTGGLVGALIAVPVASVVQTLFLFFRDRAGLADEARTEPVAATAPVVVADRAN